MTLPVWSSMLAGIADSEIIVAVRIEGRPVAKERPRRGKGGRFYTPRSTKEGEAWIAHHLGAAMTGPPATGEVGMRCYFSVGGRRVDIDNLLKSLLDAANGVVWADDSQCSRILAERSPDSPEHTQVVIYSVEDAE